MIRNLSFFSKNSFYSKCLIETHLKNSSNNSFFRDINFNQLSYRYYKTNPNIKQQPKENIQKSSNTTLETQERINGLLKLFPPIKYGFAYGSGVISQKGYNRNEDGSTTTEDPTKKESPMIDLIFAVENSTQWHSLNLVNNLSHYSFLGLMGAHIVSKVQFMGAKIYFNTLLEHNGIKFKYGVIEYKDLIDDLKNWRTLYLSGRMQKPIVNLPTSTNEGLKEIEEINSKYNLKNAVITSLLMLPETFTEYDLYHTISKLSYSGDIRMKGAENPMKTHNIVINNIDGFRSLYFPIINDYLSEYLNVILENGDEVDSGLILSKYLINYGGGTKNNKKNNDKDDQRKIIIKFKSKQDPMNYLNLLMMLPDCIKSPMLKEVRNNMKLKRPDEKIDPTILHNLIFVIVSKSSFTQTLKGALTAGFSKSLNYMKLKLSSSKKK
ncbi:hypothetical protein RB653_002921 [Dictyostelium firmibasis]|uniref:Phosphatidate cytidylyltransferase, mitochondrial n=1 Tax=Dictyostelium firmibasis TaxID=79012 RepID=A0AAN7TYM9_9MYCE